MAELTGRAVEIVAAETGLTVADLTVANAAWAEYPESGQRVLDVKVLNAKTGEVSLVTLTETGQPRDSEHVLAEEHAARQRKYGKMSPELFEVASANDSEKPLPVLAVLAVPEAPASITALGTTIKDVRPTEAALGAAVAQARDRRRSEVQKVESIVRPRLATLGIHSTSFDTAGMLAFEATPEQLEAIQKWPEVLDLSLSGFSDDDLDISLATTFSNIVHNRGFTGSGVKVAQVENHNKVGHNPPSNNPYISVTQDPNISCGAPQHHAIKVAGVIRSTHSTWKGHAPGVNLFATGACDGNDGTKQAATINALNWGATAINLSWSRTGTVSYDATTKFYDGVTWWNYATVLASPGNTTGCGDTPANQVLRPGNGYNVITVGGYDDRNTVNKFDDIHHCSGYLGPDTEHDDNQKPEIVAPAANIWTTDHNPPHLDGSWFVQSSGTSVAVPVVTGVAALLTQRSYYLGYYPTALKAILLVSSQHPIQNSSLLDPLVGVGGVEADYADDVTSGARGGWNGLDYYCSSPSSINLVTFPAVAGKKYRVAISWMADPNYTYAYLRPSSDLDLEVYGPSGLVAGSWGFDRTYELAQYVAPTTGNHTIRATVERCNSDPRQLSWAVFYVP